MHTLANFSPSPQQQQQAQIGEYSLIDPRQPEVISKIVNRPQSPRHFFERLYGHLENSENSVKQNSCNNNNNNNNNDNSSDTICIQPSIISPLRSELSSSSDVDERYVCT